VGWTTDRIQFRFPTGYEIVLFSTAFWPASYAMGTGGSFLGIKQQRCEADHSPPSSAEVNETFQAYLRNVNFVNSILVSLRLIIQNRDFFFKCSVKMVTYFYNCNLKSMEVIKYSLFLNAKLLLILNIFINNSL
jgi:hypothetical protein